jgi:two-component system, OmpR family, sensor histidine kinase VicK
MSKSLRVLVVDDSEDDAILLIRELRRGGHEVNFQRIDTPEAMSSALANDPWDLVISDYTMPSFSGLEALELLQTTAIDIPFIMVSGSIGEETAVNVMKAGAHDYLMKGNLPRLIPSVERELREAEVRRERRRVEEENRRNWRRIQALHDVDLAVTSTLDIETVLDILLEKIEQLLPNSATTIKLLDRDPGELQPVACRNLVEKQWKTVGQKALAGLAKIVLENRIPLTVANVQTDPRNANPSVAIKEGLISYLGIPLIAKNETLGLIAFYTKDSHQFGDDEIDFLTTLAGQASVAISNSLLYEQSRKQTLELEVSNKVKDEFLSVTSHELRTPLNLILGYTAMIAEGVMGDISSDQKHALDKVANHSKELLSMINDMLYATSLEAKVMKPEIENLDLVEFLDGLKASYSILLDKQIDLNWSYPADLPKMKSDERKLKQILQNLISNAIKFTDRGTVTVSARYEPHNGEVQFRVADTGVGIPEQMRNIIFEKFRQGDSSGTRAYGGVGLGLYIVKNFVELLDGRIEVESELGRESTFIITLPIEPPAAIQTGAPRTESEFPPTIHSSDGAERSSVVGYQSSLS